MVSVHSEVVKGILSLLTLMHHILYQKRISLRKYLKPGDKFGVLRKHHSRSWQPAASEPCTALLSAAAPHWLGNKVYTVGLTSCNFFYLTPLKLISVFFLIYGFNDPVKTPDTGVKLKKGLCMTMRKGSWLGMIVG